MTSVNKDLSSQSVSLKFQTVLKVGNLLDFVTCNLVCIVKYYMHKDYFCKLFYNKLSVSSKSTINKKNIF